MKKIFTIASLMILSVVILAGCSKRSYDYGYDEDYWLRQESGIVVYSDNYCPFYVVETNRGYTIVRSVSGLQPFEGDEIYGDLSRRGYMDLFNWNDNAVIRSEITDYWLTYSEAQYIIDNVCYTYSKTASKKVIKTNVAKTERRSK